MATYQNYNRENEYNNIKLYDYQNAIQIKSGRDTLVCNWARGLGATYTIMATILKEKPNNVLYFKGNNDRLKALNDKYNEILHTNNGEICIDNEFTDKIKDIIHAKDKTKITFFNNQVVNIINWYSIPIGHEVMNFDYIFFDGILPTPLKDITGNRTISFVTTNNYDNHLEKLYGNNTTNILNEDYNTGLENGLFDKQMLDKITKDIQDTNNIKRWYDSYAIMDRPRGEVVSYISNKDANRKYELYQSLSITPANKFLIDSLVGLEEEYDLIAKTKDTVLTRRNLLEMITQLYKNIGIR